MRQARRLLMVLSLWATLILLAGCGSNLTSGTGGAVQTTQPPTSTGTVSTSETSVMLQTSALFYQTKDTISVTLSNQSSRTISFPDHLTDCTVLLLLQQKVQPQANGSGQPGIDLCQLATPTRLYSLSPRQQLNIKLMPPASGWTPGLYSVTLSYRTSVAASSTTELRSGVFTIGSSAPQP